MGIKAKQLNCDICHKPGGEGDLELGFIDLSINDQKIAHQKCWTRDPEAKSWTRLKYLYSVTEDIMSEIQTWMSETIVGTETIDDDTVAKVESVLIQMMKNNDVIATPINIRLSEDKTAVIWDGFKFET